MFEIHFVRQEFQLNRVSVSTFYVALSTSAFRLSLPTPGRAEILKSIYLGAQEELEKVLHH